MFLLLFFLVFESSDLEDRRQFRLDEDLALQAQVADIALPVVEMGLGLVDKWTFSPSHQNRVDNRNYFTILYLNKYSI